eukprot:TRINITY_DN7950_c0_g1_i1.p1 TRINITY_DN7950_c0_g1~~TRINITY_DN7950_c0_g1_i1.p1  ORF type:complete len:651 (-),score=50.41 TRINITY_DN7950_c0_g1_i1:349-2301(-)
MNNVNNNNPWSLLKPIAISLPQGMETEYQGVLGLINDLYRKQVPEAQLLAADDQLAGSEDKYVLCKNVKGYLARTFTCRYFQWYVLSLYVLKKKDEMRNWLKYIIKWDYSYRTLSANNTIITWNGNAITNINRVAFTRLRGNINSRHSVKGVPKTLVDEAVSEVLASPNLIPPPPAPNHHEHDPETPPPDVHEQLQPEAEHPAHDNDEPPQLYDFHPGPHILNLPPGPVIYPPAVLPYPQPNAEYALPDNAPPMPVTPLIYVRNVDPAFGPLVTIDIREIQGNFQNVCPILHPDGFSILFSILFGEQRAKLRRVYSDRIYVIPPPVDTPQEVSVVYLDIVWDVISTTRTEVKYEYMDNKPYKLTAKRKFSEIFHPAQPLPSSTSSTSSSTTTTTSSSSSSSSSSQGDSLPLGDVVFRSLPPSVTLPPTEIYTAAQMHDMFGWNNIHLCCYVGDISDLEDALENAADIDGLDEVIAKDHFNRTPAGVCIRLATEGYMLMLHMLEVLIRYGAVITVDMFKDASVNVTNFLRSYNGPNQHLISMYTPSAPSSKDTTCKDNELGTPQEKLASLTLASLLETAQTSSEPPTLASWYLTTDEATSKTAMASHYGTVLPHHNHVPLIIMDACRIHCNYRHPIYLPHNQLLQSSLMHH